MSFERTDILKFSEVINNDTYIRYKNLEKFDNKVVSYEKFHNLIIKDKY